MFKLIILDFDGTLCATHEAIVFCIQQTFSLYNYPSPSREAIEAVISTGVKLEQTFQHLLNVKELPANWISTYREIYNAKEGIARTRLFAGAAEAVQALHKAGCHNLVISNKGKLAIDNALAYFNLSAYITLVIGDTQGVKPKPDPMLYHTFIQPNYHQIAPEQILVVGDTTADLLFAQNIGAKSCWASYGYGKASECLKLKPEYVIANMHELTDIVGIA